MELLYVATHVWQQDFPSLAFLFLHPQLNLALQLLHFIFVGFKNYY